MRTEKNGLIIPTWWSKLRWMSEART